MKDTLTVKFYPQAEASDVASALKALKTIDKTDLKEPALPKRDEPAPKAFHCVLCGFNHGNNPDRCETLKTIIERQKSRTANPGDDEPGTLLIEAA